MAEAPGSGPIREESFKDRIVGSAPLLGTFVKTAATQNIEILGSLGFDFIVIDREHASLGVETVDLMLLAARARRLPALVRVADDSGICPSLDGGADGVIVPHVSSVAQAADMVAACRYAGGRRGYSNSPRAGEYGGVALEEHVRHQDAAVVVVVMIEDEMGATRAGEISSVTGVDAVFIGCADLAVSMGEASADSPPVRDTIQKAAWAAAAVGRRVLVPAGSLTSARWMWDFGINALVVSSDQGLFRTAAMALRHGFPGSLGPPGRAA